MEFLSLPGEIRNIIYQEVLVEAPVWERRHSAFCPYCPRKESDIPIPPYVLTIQRADIKLPVCPCVKRLGLSLLRTCRQVYLEGIPLFWTENSFVFKDRNDFIACVLKTSASSRRLLASVTILDHRRRMQHLGDHAHGLRRAGRARLWEAIFQLCGLRVLQLDPAYLDHDDVYTSQFSARLPALEGLWACTLNCRAYNAPRGTVPSFAGQAAGRLPAIYFLASLKVRLHIDEFAEDMDQLASGFSTGTDFAENLTSGPILDVVVTGGITTVMGIPSSRGAVNPVAPGAYADESEFPHEAVQDYLNRPVEEFDVESRDCVLEIMGLPGSAEELVGIATRVEANKRMRKEGYKQMADALIQAKGWASERRQRASDLVLAGLLVAAFVVVVECYRWSSMPWEKNPWGLIACEGVNFCLGSVVGGLYIKMIVPVYEGENNLARGIIIGITFFSYLWRAIFYTGFMDPLISLGMGFR